VGAFYLAGVIIQDDKERILLIHRNREHHEHWEIPGGKIEEGEDPAATATREADEELGVKVEILEKLGDKFFTEHLHAGTFTNHFTWFRAKIVDGGVPRAAEPKSFDAVEYFSLEAIQRGDIKVSAAARDFGEEVAAGRIKL
jgi:8-oxo-dGTP pyrophosphatase MutT (NUDIX family)